MDLLGDKKPDPRQDPPFQPETHRTLWIGWGANGVSLALQIIFGGLYFGYLFLFGSIAMVMRGVKPAWFALHHEEQPVAGLPYRRSESTKAWMLVISVSFVFAFLATGAHHRVAPEKPDLAKTIIDGIKSGFQPKSAPTKPPGPPPTSAPTVAEVKPSEVRPPPYAYIEVDLIHRLFSSFPVSVINHGLSLRDGVATIQQGTGGLLKRALTPPANGNGFSYSKVDLSTPIPLGDLAKQSTDPFYSLDSGDYKLELRIDQDIITEHLNIAFRDGEWTRSIEVNTKGKVVFSTPALPNQPDISLIFVNTGSLGLVIENTSKAAVLKDPYYRVVLWPLSKVDPLHPFEWVKNLSGYSISRRGSLGGIELAANSEMAANTTKGDEMFGYATVNCPECIRSRTYTVGFEIGGKGWYSELPPGSSPLATGEFAKNILKSWGSVNSIPATPGDNRQMIFERPRY